MLLKISFCLLPTILKLPAGAGFVLLSGQFSNISMVTHIYHAIDPSVDSGLKRKQRLFRRFWELTRDILVRYIN